MSYDILTGPDRGPPAFDWRRKAEDLERELKNAMRLLRRYRTETPPGHQPHMIAHEVDRVLEGHR